MLMQFFSVPLMFLFFAVCIFFIRSVHVLKKGKGIAASVLLAGLASSVGEAVNQLPEQKSPSQNVGKMFQKFKKNMKEYIKIKYYRTEL